jgi:hypothetical protein
MLTRILAVATALLALLVIHQYNRIADLNGEVVDVRKHALADARASVGDTLEGQGAEMRRAIQWLHEFYRSDDGLQRSNGLWIDGHPDYEGIGYWIFEVYFRDRLKGMTEEQARHDVENGIKQSEEWHAKHRS